ncbi:DUF2218 domain-containing protein [Nonomuraea sp. NEAU-A123]|uniref:DUF2218 domain-containing protein n=1 Tax=Nonomuraea sp. NEAU-A123 TaxID=2839649 RepID=UPI001BE407ED|nr:DUF2218 domain-containing protein [Nonomuraea sp. NEAU-A123]MBT2225765.1 DUF2218 domain-containing protein [Nonomuraea sp. NEAU-A123]
MPILKAQIETERASRYLVQFCKHAAAMGRGGGHTPRMHLRGMMDRRELQVTAEWSDTEGTVTFAPWGQCTLAAEAGALTLLVEAADEDGLRQIRDIVSRDFERFSRRDPLTVTWHRSETSDAAPEIGAPTPPENGASAPTHRRGRLRANLQAILLAAAVVVIIGLHVGLAGTVVANSAWTGMAANVVVALVVLKIAFIALARFGLRRRKAAKTPDGS